MSTVGRKRKYEKTENSTDDHVARNDKIHKSSNDESVANTKREPIEYVEKINTSKDTAAIQNRALSGLRMSNETNFEGVDNPDSLYNVFSKNDFIRGMENRRVQSHRIATDDEVPNPSDAEKSVNSVNGGDAQNDVAQRRATVRSNREIVDIFRNIYEMYKLCVVRANRYEQGGQLNDAAIAYGNAARLLITFIENYAVHVSDKSQLVLRSLIVQFLNKAIQLREININGRFDVYLSLDELNQKVQRLVDKGQEDNSSNKSKYNVVSTDKIQKSFEKLYGINDLKEQLYSVLAFPTERSNLLLFGPPGTGKTYIAAALAKEFGYDFVEVGSSSLLSSYIGENEKNIAEFFNFLRARRDNGEKICAFIDEADGLIRNRDSPNLNSYERSIITVFLTQLEGASTDNRGILFILTTNDPESIDPAIRRRFSGIMIGLPDRTARISIIRGLLSEYHHTVDDQAVERVATMTECFSPADLKNLIRLARDYTQKLWQRSDKILGSGYAMGIKNNYRDNIWIIAPTNAHRSALVEVPRVVRDMPEMIGLPPLSNDIVLNVATRISPTTSCEEYEAMTQKMRLFNSM